MLTENLFDHNGWNEDPASGSSPSVFSHAIYLQDTNGPVTAVGNIITNSPDNGLKARNGGDISDNLFARNGDQLLVYQLGEDGAVYGFNQNVSHITNNVILEGQDIGANPAGGGMDIAVNAPGAGPVQISGNIIAHSTSANGSAIILTPDAVNGSVTNNIIYDWHDGIANSGVGNTISDNKIDVNADNAEGYNFLDPNRSINRTTLRLVVRQRSMLSSQRRGCRAKIIGTRFTPPMPSMTISGKDLARQMAGRL